MDGFAPEFGTYSNENLESVIRRAEMDLRLSRNDAARYRRIAALLDAALFERAQRIDAPPPS